jgi:ankyrin repeat protein
VAQLKSFELKGVDTSRWCIDSRPRWAPVDATDTEHVPPSSPLHAWLGFARTHHDYRDRIVALFEALLETGCDDPAILNGIDARGRTPLIYSLRTEPRISPDSSKLLPFRLLMAHPSVDATLCCKVSHAKETAMTTSPLVRESDGPPAHATESALTAPRIAAEYGATIAPPSGEPPLTDVVVGGAGSGPPFLYESALRTALYMQESGVVLQVLAAHREPEAALMYRWQRHNLCMLLFEHPPLARAFLPGLAARHTTELFLHGFRNAGDFAGELVQFPDDLLWRAVIARVPSEFRLPIRTRPEKFHLSSDWPNRDALRQAIAYRAHERSLWLLAHTADDDLDARDFGGRTVLMRAIMNGEQFVNLILALLKRAPALDIEACALFCPSDGGRLLLGPGSLARPDLVSGANARGLLLIHFDHSSAAFKAISAAFDDAAARHTLRCVNAVPLLAMVIDIPPQLRTLVAAYATLLSQPQSTKLPAAVPTTVI